MSDSKQEREYNTIRELRDEGFGSQVPPSSQERGEEPDPKQFGAEVAEELLNSIETALQDAERG